MGVSYTVAWCVTWILSYRLNRNILKANLLAIFLTPFILLMIPAAWINLVMVRDIAATDYRQFSFIMSGLLILSHWKPLQELFRL